MSVFNTSTNHVKKIAIASAFIMSTSVLLSACSKEEHHEVPAIDKVQEAQELARANAPEPEVVELPAAETTETDGEATDAPADTTEEATAENADGSETELQKADAIEEAAALGEPAPSSATDTDNTAESAN